MCIRDRSVYAANGLNASDFHVYENNEATDSVLLAFNDVTSTYFTGYSEQNASNTVLIGEISDTNTVKLGVHALAFSDDITILQNYQEVLADRELSTVNQVVTKTETRSDGTPLRYAVRSNPIKITPK